MTAPLLLCLPGGIRAEYVAGSRPARYEIEGEPCDLDVTIPEDLAGWTWHGSFLSDGHVGIFTGTFGVSGAIAQARKHMRLRADAPLVQLSLFEVAA